MAQYETREVTTRRKEFVLELPTDFIEVEKLMAGIRQSVDLTEPHSFPWVEVTATEQELIFSYDFSKKVEY